MLEDDGAFNQLARIMVFEYDFGPPRSFYMFLQVPKLPRYLPGDHVSMSRSSFEVAEYHIQTQVSR